MLLEAQGTSAPERRYKTVRCINPKHRDRHPSMSLNIKTGSVWCRACGFKGRMDAGACNNQSNLASNPLELPAQELLSKSRPCDMCTDAEITLARRNISLDTAGELGIRVLDMRARAFFAMPYFDEAHVLRYFKFRPADNTKQGFFRFPRGQAHPLFNIAALGKLRDDEASIVTEGEFDVAALHEMGIYGAVSVPDGAATRATPSLLAVLDRFDEMLIGTDNDQPGEDLASRLINVLGPRRCRRIVWRMGVDCGRN